ncbi:hypothetical protein EJ07DRAFT_155710 [Lizonia empirigonia]|nr:hypothetical protein EJ07DRAFT_155710 [Lizonia empirigonia]
MPSVGSVYLWGFVLMNVALKIFTVSNRGIMPHLKCSKIGVGIRLHRVSNVVGIWEQRSEARLLRKSIWISILQKFGERSLEVPCAHSGATISGLKQLDADQETSVARFCGVTEHVQEDLFSHEHRAGETLQGWVESQLLPEPVQFASVDVVGVLASEKKEKNDVRR